MEDPGFKGFPFQIIQHIWRPNIILITFFSHTPPLPLERSFVRMIPPKFRDITFLNALYYSPTSRPSYYEPAINYLPQCLVHPPSLAVPEECNKVDMLIRRYLDKMGHTLPSSGKGFHECCKKQNHHQP